MGIYMEVFSLQSRAQIYILHIYLWGWAKMKFLCRYTNSESVAQLAMLYMRERMYATVYAVRSFNFPKFVRMYRTYMHHDKSLLHTCIVPPLISLLLSYVTLIHYDVVSRELHHVVGTDGNTSWK